MDAASARVCTAGSAQSHHALTGAVRSSTEPRSHSSPLAAGRARPKHVNVRELGALRGLFGAPRGWKWKDMGLRSETAAHNERVGMLPRSRGRGSPTRTDGAGRPHRSSV